MTTRGLIDEIAFHLCELHKIFLTQSRRVAQTRLRATGERAKRRDTIKIIISNHSDYMNVKMFTVRRINWKWFSQQADVARGILCVFFCISGEGRKRKWNSILLCSDVVCDAGWIMCGDWEKRNRDQACVWWCNFFPSLPFFLVVASQLIRNGFDGEGRQRWRGRDSLSLLLPFHSGFAGHSTVGWYALIDEMVRCARVSDFEANRDNRSCFSLHPLIDQWVSRPVPLKRKTRSFSRLLEKISSDILERTL